MNRRCSICLVSSSVFFRNHFAFINNDIFGLVGAAHDVLAEPYKFLGAASVWGSCTTRKISRRTRFQSFSSLKNQGSRIDVLSRMKRVMVSEWIILTSHVLSQKTALLINTQVFTITLFERPPLYAIDILMRTAYVSPDDIHRDW